MSRENKYTVVLLDADGYEIADRVADTLKEAKATMLYMLSGRYAEVAESTHCRMGTEKAEIRNSDDECVVDKFLD